MKITEALVVLFLVLFCYLFLDKFLFRGELGEICFGPTCRALARWHRRQAVFSAGSFRDDSAKAAPRQASDGSRYP